MSPAPDASDLAVSTEPPSRLSLFTAFLKIGCLGFGGVAPLARHVLVDERALMSEREFAEAFGLASTIPGANTVNLATMLGDRYRGVSGGVTCVAGLIAAPLVILVALAMLYARFSALPDVKAGLLGAATAAAGLVIGTSLKLLKGLDPDIAALASTGAVCLASALLRAPMLLILAVAIPLSLLMVFARRRRA